MSLRNIEDAARRDARKIEAEIPKATGWVKTHWIVAAVAVFALAVVLIAVLT